MFRTRAPAFWQPQRRKLVSTSRAAATGMHTARDLATETSFFTLSFWLRRTSSDGSDTIWAGNAGLHQVYNNASNANIIARVPTNRTAALPAHALNAWHFYVVHAGENFAGGTTDLITYQDNVQSASAVATAALTEMQTLGTHWLLGDDSVTANTDAGYIGEVYDFCLFNGIIPIDDLQFRNGRWQDLTQQSREALLYRIDGQGPDAGWDASERGNHFVVEGGGVTLSLDNLPPGANTWIMREIPYVPDAPAGGGAQGNLAVTEAADTAAIVGQVVVQGDLAATEAVDVSAVSGAVLVQGTLATTEAADTFAASGGVVTSGDLAVTEATDTAAFVGAVLVQGDLAATEVADTAAMSGTVLVQGDLIVTESVDVLAASGVVVLNAITGDLASTEATDTLAGAGAVLVQGDLVVTETADIFAATAGVVSQGDLAVTEAIDVAAFVGSVVVQGDLAATETADTATFVGIVVIQGDLAATETADTFAATAAAAQPLSNNRISAMHFQRHYEPIAVGA